MSKAIFSRKPDCLETLQNDTAELLRLFGERAYSDYVICSEIELSKAEWNDLTTSFLNDRDWIESFTQEGHLPEGNAPACIRVSTASSKIKLIIDPQGYSYARYVAIEAL